MKVTNHSSKLDHLPKPQATNTPAAGKAGSSFGEMLKGAQPAAAAVTGAQGAPAADAVGGRSTMSLAAAATADAK